MEAKGEACGEAKDRRGEALVTPAPPTPEIQRATLPEKPGLVGEVFGQRGGKWREHWWGMPSFEMRDASPMRAITVNFYTEEDVKEFSRRLDVRVPSKRTDSVWFPRDRDRGSRGQWLWKGTTPEKYLPRFPVFIPSKGRWQNPMTSRLLTSMGVPHKLVVEPQEAARYKRAVGEDKVIVMPFGNLGLASIPARNYIWKMAKDQGAEYHWLIDDNILRFYRMTLNRRVITDSPAIFKAAEDFTLRYENIGMAGLNEPGYAYDRDPNVGAFTLNTRVYSVSLIRTDLPHRWRGRYNEDTDLCLRLLKDGWCIVNFNAFLGDKVGTVSTISKGMAGGNASTIYATGDHRREFAESLRRQHPDCVEVVWKFHRWHHQVDYSRFRNNQLRLRKGVTPMGEPNEYGMELRKREPRPVVRTRGIVE